MTSAQRRRSRPDAQPSGSRAARSTSRSTLTFPDDGPVSRYVRIVDNYLGKHRAGAAVRAARGGRAHRGERRALRQGARAPHGPLVVHVVRGGTFTIAMFGAAFATHQQRHLAMDLVSRRLSPRGRLILGVVLKLFTIVDRGRSCSAAACTSASTSAAARRRVHLRQDDRHDAADRRALIILHSFLHIVIDVDYLVRGKLPPEQARSGH